MSETSPSGRLIETRGARDLRVSTFYVIIAALLLTLVVGLANQQLFKSGMLQENERLQTQRRILIPGPRGNIYDRYRRLLVGNQSRFSVVLYLDELQAEFRRESIRIRNNYRATGDRDLPTWPQMEQIAHVSVAQRYLDEVNAIIGRNDAIDGAALRRHFERELYMPYTLENDLAPVEFARLLEKLPTRSPLQVYATTERTYPFGSLASHVLGYVGVEETAEAEDFPGAGLKTFPMPGTVGRDGLEKWFDALLQGQPGGSIFRVDPAGYKVNDKPLEYRQPIQGHDLVTSLDIDLQRAAEDSLEQQTKNDEGEQTTGTGAAVALDVRTGEVLVLASKPDYDLNEFAPRLRRDTVADIQKSGAWLNLAIAGFYPPGSTFKTIVSVAGLRNHTLSRTDDSVDCEGRVKIGSRWYACDAPTDVHHGNLELPEAIAQSCDIYFYEHGIAIGPDAIAAEARRFHLDQPTGIELPGEAHHMLVPDPAWKKKKYDEAWTDGDTANMAIGQGYLSVTPMVMACYAASLARNEVETRPTLVHDPRRPDQHSAPIGLSPEDREAVVHGMVLCTQEGPHHTGALLSSPMCLIPGVTIAAKTGTAQYGNHLNVAWMIAFAPAEKPEIAMAVAVRSDKPGETYAGGIYAAQVVDAVFKAYFQKVNRGSAASVAMR